MHSGEHELLLGFQGVYIRIQSTAPLPIERFSEIGEDVTGMSSRIVNDTNRNDHSATLTYIEAAEIEISYDDGTNNLILEGPLSNFGTGNTITHTAHYMAECIRASESGLLLVHSAAVMDSDSNTATVLFGEKGAGKTTLALRLCHELNYGLVGNDQVYIGSDINDQVVVEGGNPYFLVRQTAATADEHVASLLNISDSVNVPSWNNKVRIAPNDIGVDIVNHRLEASKLYHVRIDHTQPRLQAQAWTGLQQSLVLHERIGRHITGQATPLHSDSGEYLGSLPSVRLDKAMRARDNLVRLILKKGVTEIFTPTSDDALEYIHTNRTK
ncbi:MAG: hypothetical protein NTV95_00955 [Candidatus Saccharibacteria bacterium]|nr:hypothetical protein [Candidatus Saccharibacteria bacterium]